MTVLFACLVARVAVIVAYLTVVIADAQAALELHVWFALLVLGVAVYDLSMLWRRGQ